MQGLRGDRRLRHAEAAEGAGDRAVGVDGAGAGEDVRDAVGAGGVDRHAVRHRRAPARVGAGVEDAVEVEGGEPAVGVAAEAGGDRATGGAWWWPPSTSRRVKVMRTGRPVARAARPRSGWTREVELGAEAAADRRGQDADALGRQRRAARRCRRGPCRGPGCRRGSPAVSPSSQAAPASGSM